MSRRVCPPVQKPDERRRVGTAADITGRKMTDQSAPEEENRKRQIKDKGAERLTIERARTPTFFRHPHPSGGR